MPFTAAKVMQGAGKWGRSLDVRTLTSSSYVGTSGTLDLPSVGGLEDLARSAELTPDGRTMFVGSYRANKIYEYTLSTAWLMSSVNTTKVATYTFTDVPTVTGNFGFSGIEFSPGGRYLYVTHGEDNEFYQWYLPTPWSLGSRIQMDGIVALDFLGTSCLNWAGDKISMIRRSSPAIDNQYPLSTPYDLDTAGATDGDANIGYLSSGAIIGGRW